MLRPIAPTISALSRQGRSLGEYKLEGMASYQLDTIRAIVECKKKIS